MELERGTFLSEHDDDTVSGMAIIETDPEIDKYRIAEKWERGPDDEVWNTYWLAESMLQERIDEGSVSVKGQLSDKQLNGILNLAGVSHKVEAA